MAEESDPRELGQGLLEPLEPFGAELCVEERQPGDVLPRVCEALDEPSIDGGGGHRHDNGDGRRRVLGGLDHRCGPHHENVNGQAH